LPSSIQPVLKTPFQLAVMRQYDTDPSKIHANMRNTHNS